MNSDVRGHPERPAGDWFPAAPTRASGEVERQEMACTTLSTIADLSYTPSEEQKSRDIAQMQATGRRCWKTLNGKAEAVWGPELEAALIEALERYKPTEGREPRSSKHGIRFPYRNRFISQYIYEKTGKIRTHKQVGSRLQQLRDTCKSRKILALISQGSCEDIEGKHKQISNHEPLPAKAWKASSSPNQDAIEARRQVVVYSRITAKVTPPPYRIPRLQCAGNDRAKPVILQLCPLSYPLSITGHSSAPLSIDQVQDQKRAYLRLLDHPNKTGNAWVYECDIAGALWKSICGLKDPKRFTILQTLTPDTTTIARTSAPIERKVSIVYHIEPDAPVASRSPQHVPQ
ncbi:hypothetical protein NMY22_g6529 [Coprinellus aureogranulatus]|nr:hypothetical protein NMY22_g6529 [Coprinellus aureogranulatus]